MEITIPARVVEAIQEGDQLRIHQHAGQFSASLKDCNERGFYVPTATTAQQALTNLNRDLPLTMAEIAIMDAKPERGQP